MTPIALNTVTTAQAAAQSVALRHHASLPDWVPILLIALSILQVVLLIVCFVADIVKNREEEDAEEVE